MNEQHWLGVLCLGFSVTVTGAQTLVEAFEYALDDKLLAAWQAGHHAKESNLRANLRIWWRFLAVLLAVFGVLGGVVWGLTAQPGLVCWRQKKFQVL